MIGKYSADVNFKLGGDIGGPKAIKANGDGNKPLTVEVVDNHVYFYADVTGDRTLAVLRDMRNLDHNFLIERKSRSLPDDHPGTPIWLHIFSYGGDLFAGFAAADQIANLNTPVYSVIEGCCASAATLLSMACTKRYILPNSFMLVHQLSTFVWGTHEEFKDEMKLQEMAMERLVQFYVERSGGKSDEESVRAMLTHDTWLSPEQALEHGFVDEILYE